MGSMLVRLQVSLEHKAESHRIATILSRVDGRANSAAKFELVSFNGHNLNERHLLNEGLWNLVVKAILFCVPASTLNV